MKAVQFHEDGGVFVSAATPGPENPDRGVRTIRMAVNGNPAELAQLVALVDRGELHIDVADRGPLAEVPDVHRQADEGRLTGETVIIF
jgi:NADPH:quinone reductase-like Zn-dependent oxidoreductase